jgi:hypothetical protein
LFITFPFVFNRYSLYKPKWEDKSRNTTQNSTPVGGAK